MKRNSRLSLALHALGHMAGAPERMQTSAEIAAHAGTNAVVVRRVFGKLRNAGLLLSEKGHAGGWRLARLPEEITLADVYTGLEEQLIAPSRDSDAPDCSVEHTLHTKLAHIMSDMEDMLLKRLSTTTLADLRQPMREASLDAVSSAP
ncbi:MAG: Rrf2 family transcriptional regulator [Pseudomonadota bacterium]